MAGTTGLGVQSLTLRCRDWGCASSMSSGAWLCYPTPQSVYVAALLFLCHLIGMPQNRDDNDATLFWHVRAALEICSAALLVDNGDLIGFACGLSAALMLRMQLASMSRLFQSATRLVAQVGCQPMESAEKVVSSERSGWLSA